MFHFARWAACLSAGIAVAMPAVRTEAALCGGTEPARDCQGRRGEYLLLATDYPEVKKTDVQHHTAGQKQHTCQEAHRDGSRDESPCKGPVDLQEQPRDDGEERQPTEGDEMWDVTGLFQTPVLVARTWEELMELFWGWFQENRQVGMAVGMVRRFLHARGDANYLEWSGPAIGALAAGIPQSEGMEFALTPEDFYVWATEVETILFAAYTAEQGAAGGAHRGGGDGAMMDGDEAAFMERGRRGGERQRRGDRSRSCRESEARRRRGARASASGSGGPREMPKPKARPGRDRSGLADAPWRRTEPATGSDGPAMVATAVAGAPAASSGDYAFVPAPPRDNDDSVDVWRFLLGIDREALPSGEETTGQDRPFFPTCQSGVHQTCCFRLYVNTAGVDDAWATHGPSCNAVGIGEHFALGELCGGAP